MKSVESVASVESVHARLVWPRNGLRLLLAVVLSVGASAAAAADRQRYTGETEGLTGFDFAIEAEAGEAKLFLAKKPTNEPWTGEAPKLVPDDEGAAPLVFEATNDPGVFRAAIKGSEVPEGDVVVKLDGEELAAESYLVEDHASHGEHKDHGHSHAVAGEDAEAASDAPAPRQRALAGAALAGALLIGVAVGRWSRRRKGDVPPSQPAAVGDGEKAVHASQASRKNGPSVDVSGVAVVFLAALTATGGARPALAGEGHTHDVLEIPGGSSNGDVSISKKAQFLVGLRTVSAVTTEVAATYQTVGHIITKPQLDASLKAPVSGRLKLEPGAVWNGVVTKGQTLARVEGATAVVITSPIAGVIFELKALDGARVEAGEPLLRVVDTSTVWVDAEVFQKDLRFLKDVTTAMIDVDGSGVRVPAKVLGIRTEVAETSLAAKVFLEVENLPGADVIPLGAISQVTFTLPSTSGKGMVVPKGAILNRGGELLVYVQTGPETFLPKPVATRAGATPDTVVVTGGLVEGDRVVVTGNYQLLVGAQ